MQNLNKNLSPLFITGTDTGVGKTVVSLLLMQTFFNKGYHPFYLKPFQTGCRDVYDTESDAAFIYRYTATLKQKDPKDSVIFCHTNPKAPYFAARDQKSGIEIKKVLGRIDQLNFLHSPLIIEGAGGLLVPVTSKKMMIDLIAECHAGTILVARAGLGTINHTLLSVEALKSRSLKIQGIIFVDSGPDPTPSDLVQENMETILNVSGIQVAGIVSRIDDFSNPPATCLAAASKLVDR